MNIEIKKAELTDSNIKAVIALSKKWESEDSTFGYCANDKSDLLGRDLFLAYSDNKIIGFLFGKCAVTEKAITPIEKGANCFEIEEIYVEKNYRSQGIGRALFEFAEHDLESIADYITLSTATKNYKSILRFYIEKTKMTFWSAKLYKRCRRN